MFWAFPLDLHLNRRCIYSLRIDETCPMHPLPSIGSVLVAILAAAFLPLCLILQTRPADLPRPQGDLKEGGQEALLAVQDPRAPVSFTLLPSAEPSLRFFFPSLTVEEVWSSQLASS